MPSKPPTIAETRAARAETRGAAPRARSVAGPLGLLLAGCVLSAGACSESSAEGVRQMPPAPPGAEPVAATVPEPQEAPETLRTPTLAASSVEGPGVRAAQALHDFGTVYAGAQLEHTFLLDAVGTEPLVIENIKPGCGCTVATPVVVEDDGSRRPYELKQPLAPGSRLELLCRFDTSGKRGPQAKAINVYCNDPRGVERLTLKVDLEEFLNTVPDSLRLGRFSIEESRSGEVVMTTRGSGPVKLSVDPRRIPAELGVEFVPRKPDAEGRASAWTVKVELGGETLRQGPFQFRIPVYSDTENPLAPESPRPDQRWLGGTIMVTAEVLDIYTYSPRQLFFGQLAPETAMSRGIAFNSFDEEHPLEELSASVVGMDGQPLPHADRYHVSVEPGNVDGTWRVELLVDGLPAGSGLFEGLLRMKTANPSRPHVDVPFKGIVR